MLSLTLNYLTEGEGSSKLLLLLLHHLFYAFLDFVWATQVSQYQKKHSPTIPLTPIVVINHPVSTSSIYYDQWHPPCSIYMPDSLFVQCLSKFSFVYLLAWHTPYIFFTHSLFSFAAHAYTIPVCFAVVPRLLLPWSKCTVASVLDMILVLIHFDPWAWQVCRILCCEGRRHALSNYSGRTCYLQYFNTIGLASGASMQPVKI